MLNFYENKVVFIAGGGGMSGQSLIKQLLDLNAIVIATEYKNRKISTTHPNLKIINLDLNDEKQVRYYLKESNIAFLTAANVGGAKSIINNSMELVKYNLPLHFNLLNWCAEEKIERVGFISSSYIYPHTGKPNVEEDGFVGNPHANYELGWIKRYLETVCIALHKTTNTNYGIIRPTAMYGPHDKFDTELSHFIPATIKRFHDKKYPIVIWGDGSHVRCHTYIDDVMSGLLTVVANYAIGEGINICSNDPVSNRDVVNILCELENIDPNNIVYDTSKPSVVTYKVSSPEKAKKVLNWEAKTSLKDGLKKTYDWYCNHVN